MNRGIKLKYCTVDGREREMSARDVDVSAFIIHTRTYLGRDASIQIPIL